ncbi:MAG: hypothetical protein HN909_04510 [Phycisphaerales bacterium]|jgi:hypothetical protein|nr:hypothetical protein [Phycisphaerales bacterium]MBT7171014.1 hypothetical protein [Phycisphaerales bacterium]
MTKRKRFEATRNNQPTDFLPRTPVLMHLVADHAKISFATFASDGMALAEANIKLFEQFEFEQLDVRCDPWRKTADRLVSISTFLMDTTMDPNLAALCEPVSYNDQNAN